MNDKKKICPLVCVFIEPIIPMKAEENAMVEKLPPLDDNKGYPDKQITVTTCLLCKFFY